MGETAVAPPTPEESDSFLSRAVGVFISPGAAFESIAQRPNFLAPLIVVTVATIAVIEAMLDKLGAEQIARRSIEMTKQAASLSADQIAQQAHQAAPITAIFMRVIGVLAPVVMVLIIAAVGLFIANVLFGGKANFKTAFSVVCYADLVGLVGGVLTAVMVFFGDPEQFNVQNPIPSNVGFFLNMHDTPKALYAIASSFDIFTIWMLLLTALGLSAATARKARPVPIFLSYMGIWIVWVLIKAGLALATG